MLYLIVFLEVEPYRAQSQFALLTLLKKTERFVINPLLQR